MLIYIYSLNFLSVIAVLCACCVCLCCLIRKRAKRRRYYEAFTNVSETPKEELELDDKDAQKGLQSQYRQLPSNISTENVYDELPTTW